MIDSVRSKFTQPLTLNIYYFPLASPRVSIITITFNAAAVLEATMQSVFAQTFTDYEYMIIDGGSTDGTVDIILRNESRISYWVTEPDKGLYDAMNKGLHAAEGEYVWFMNAGDCFFDKYTLSKVFKQSEPDADVYYGDALFFDETGKELGLRSQITPHQLPEKLSWQSFHFGMVVCHQAFVPRRRIAPPYDLSHHYSSDIDWEIRCLKQAGKVVNTRATLCRYLTGGFSVKHHRKSLQDRYLVLQKHYGVIPNFISHLYITIRGVLHTATGKKAASRGNAVG